MRQMKSESLLNSQKPILLDMRDIVRLVLSLYEGKKFPELYIVNGRLYESNNLSMPSDNMLSK